MSVEAKAAPANTAVRRDATDRVHLWLMLALTFSTGIADTAGYLGLEKIFAGNMTGNVVILGIGLSGTAPLPILGPSFALGSFMIGALIAGIAIRSDSSGWDLRVSALFGVATILLTGAAVAVYVWPQLQKDGVGHIAVASTLAVAMGLQAATARHLKVTDVTTVVITSTLAALASEARIAGHNGKHFGRRIGSVLLILAGAGTGALMLQAGLGLPLAATALITGCVTLVGHRRMSKDARPR